MYSGRSLRGCLCVAACWQDHSATYRPTSAPPPLLQIDDKKLKGRLRYTEGVVRDAQSQAAKVDEWLLPNEAGGLEAEGMERTWRFQQQAIVKAAEAGAARKVFDLSLTELGPYSLDVSRSGRHMLLGGRKGHLALMDWQRMHTVCEVQVRETVRDVKILHNESFFAAAQKQHVYIYDKRGIEVHCLKVRTRMMNEGFAVPGATCMLPTVMAIPHLLVRIYLSLTSFFGPNLQDHTEVHRLEFLPHHFLLASVGSAGVLRYQDTSTGQMVAEHRTRQGPCDVMRQNPWNAVLCLGHANGTVTMWTPNLTTPAVRMLCHHGPVRAVALDQTGRHMVTAGADGQVKVWDARTYRELHSYFSAAPADWLDVSQRGMLAVGHGRRVQVWQDALETKAPAPYLNHTLPGGTLQQFQFCPYEDVLAVAHSGGVSTLLVPGAGEPNYDSFVADPFQSQRQRREAEVHQLLDKLQPEMITLDPGAVGRVQRQPSQVQKERQAEAEAANAARLQEERGRGDEKSRMKGKNKPTRRRAKKQRNIIEDRKQQMKADMREQGTSAEFGHKRAEAAAAGSAVPEQVPRALHRFYKK